ncbi:Ricin-type beta-trefoil lectin domain protein [compost metagenome]
MLFTQSQTAMATKYTYTKSGQLVLMSYSADKYVNFQYDKNGNQVGRKILNCLNSEYKLINVNSNKALDVQAGDTSSGTRIQIDEDNGTDAQRWLICSAANESYKLINVHSGKALDVTGGSTVDGASVQI